jgi:cell wall integrity and stress response component
MALLLLALLAWQVSASSDITYCSTVNTGASNAASKSPRLLCVLLCPSNHMHADVSIYQSNGLCTDNCNADYAFGILQGKSCWCSNIAPNKATNVGTSKCDTGCPGYPDDSCGSASDGVFAYVQMNLHSPSGTATVSSSTSTSTESSVSNSLPISLSLPIHAPPGPVDLASL